MISYKATTFLIAGATALSYLFSSPASGSPIQYPSCQRVEQIDNYHGIQVQDPYRLLEDSSQPETQQWIQEQNALTSSYLKQIPQRDEIHQKLMTLTNYEKWGNFSLHGNRYFLLKNDGLQNQFVIYTLESLKDTPQLLLDPNLFSKDGTTALSFCIPNSDGTLLAYGLSQSGSDWVEIKVRDVQTKQDLADTLKWVKFSVVAWHPDGKGFYYCRYDAPNLGKEYDELNDQQKIYFHCLGTTQDEDILIYENALQKDYMYSICVSDDDKYLIISATKGCDPNNKVFLKELVPQGPVKELFPDSEASFSYIGNKEDFYWFKTSHQADRFKVIGFDLKKPEQWTEIIPEQKESLIEVNFVGERLIAHYLKNACSQIRIFFSDGTFEKELTQPDFGTVSSFSGKPSDKETFYSFTSYTQAPSIYRYDFAKGESQLIYQPLHHDCAHEYETKQVFYQSRDGTSVPMFLCYKKGLELDGNNPVNLYGYGGFDIPLTPSYASKIIIWMDLGGVYAVANIRGGGEFGKSWHDAGRRRNKQNGFDDFIAAAEWLIDQKYTCPSKLAISGGSNGGLLVGACLNQRPELFGAAIPAVGVMDMLRFPQFTIGRAWISEYGSPDDPTDFSYLYQYSPLHNIKKGTSYPPTLILTGDKDDRVVPAHSFKYAATLQDAQASSNPILIRIETSAGHGAGKPLSKVMDEIADQLAFLIHHLQ